MVMLEGNIKMEIEEIAYATFVRNEINLMKVKS